MVTVHQALHGYADGHRQLACSVNLPAKDARQLLVMSDVSGPGIASLGLSYLTGYPLVEAGMYALARTWPAPEMSRPGCVWTHTLLVGFADLATMESPSVIVELFKRPMARTSSEGYSSAFVINPQDGWFQRSMSGEACSWFEKLATAVYEHPHDQVWARREEGPDVDDAVLRMWDQQWPRLKRSFRFCTLTSRDRSQDGMPFDLQLTLGGESGSHLRFSSADEGFEAISKSTGPWLEDLVHDAQSPHASTLRPFLRRLGADMLGGRETMQAFCSLHAVLETADSHGVSEAVRIIESSTSFSASKLVRSMVVQAAMTNLSSVDGHVVDFVVENLTFLSDDAIGANQAALALLMWERDPRRLLELTQDPREAVREAIRGGAASIPASAVLGKLAQIRDLAGPLLTLIPAIAEDPYFWECTQLMPMEASKAGVVLSNDAVVQAMIAGLREPNAIRSGVKAVGSLRILDCLQRLIGQHKIDGHAHLWLQILCADVNAVASFICNSPTLSVDVLLLLTSSLEPDAIPNDIGIDPWYRALDVLVSTAGGLPVELQIYGFRRALGRRSRSVGELFRLTFEPLHVAATNDAFSDEQWQQLERDLPWQTLGSTRGRADRLRHAVARKCSDLDLSAGIVTRLVESDKLFLQLLEDMWELWGGSSYIRSLSNSLDRRSPRYRLLKQFVKQHSKFW